MKSHFRIVVNEVHSFNGIKSSKTARERFNYWVNQKTIGSREEVRRVWLLQDNEMIAYWNKPE